MYRWLGYARSPNSAYVPAACCMMWSSAWKSPDRRSISASWLDPQIGPNGKGMIPFGNMMPCHFRPCTRSLPE